MRAGWDNGSSGDVCDNGMACEDRVPEIKEDETVGISVMIMKIKVGNRNFFTMKCSRWLPKKMRESEQVEDDETAIIFPYQRCN